MGSEVVTGYGDWEDVVLIGSSRVLVDRAHVNVRLFFSVGFTFLEDCRDV